MGFIVILPREAAGILHEVDETVTVVINAILTRCLRISFISILRVRTAEIFHILGAIAIVINTILTLAGAIAFIVIIFITATRISHVD